MEITFDRKTLYGILILASFLTLLGVAVLGRPFTPVKADGNVRLLTWSDWQLFKAERRYLTEQSVLRSDADALAALLERPSDPVAAQLLAERVNRHCVDGEAALLPARSALQQAAQDVVNWSAGVVERDIATSALQAVNNLLK